MPYWFFFFYDNQSERMSSGEHFELKQGQSVCASKGECLNTAEVIDIVIPGNNS